MVSMKKKKSTVSQFQKDPIEPFIFPTAKVLILGTFPAPAARESGFYYAHPTNRFWPVLAELFDEPVPGTIEERKAFLRRHHIALWNVCGACKIDGSKDSSIKEPVINNIAERVKGTDIKYIFTSGKVAGKLYRKYCMAETGIKDVYLPSTSAVNRPNYSFDKLVEAHKVILNCLEREGI